MQFTEAFPTLKLNDLSDIFSNVEVEKIFSNNKIDFLDIHVSANRLIHKEIIYKAENEIKKQLFPGRPIMIKIHEKFRLSAQYNPEKLIHIYRDSIYLELKSRPVLLNILKKSSFDYPDENQVILIIDDTASIPEKAEELIKYLEEVLINRCGMNISVRLKYANEKKESNSQFKDEAKINAKINEVSNIARGPKPADTNSDSENAVPESIRAVKTVPEDESYVLAEENNEITASKPKTKSFISSRKSRNKRSDNPDIIYGGDFDDDEITALEDITGEIGEVIIRGKIITLELRSIKNDKTIVIFSLTDFTDTIKIKIFIGDELLDKISADITIGAFVKIKGIAVIDKFDSELTIASIIGIKKALDFTSIRMDESNMKRVELHCHTKMSEMDGVSEAKNLIERAYKWGHKAIAITDHGVVQAFPEAYSSWNEIWQKEKKRKWEEEGLEAPDKADFFKIIYGVEAYLVDDLHEIVTNPKTQTLDGDFVVFDIETTGFSPLNNRIIEIGAVRIHNNEISERYQSFVDPHVPVSFEIEKLTGINDDMLMEAKDINTVLPEFLTFIGDTPLIAHNAAFDMSFILENCRLQGIEKDFTYIDTLSLARFLMPEEKKHTLEAVCKALYISQDNYHRADSDAECTAQIFLKFMPRLKKMGIETLAEINKINTSTPEMIKKLHSCHAIILAANEAGRKNLYTLVSESHLSYYSRRPRIPKSVINKYREGLIIGSGCEAGELFSALLSGKSAADIARIINFYDYLEIQPAGNNQFMVKSEKISTVNSIEDIKGLNRRIVKLGEDYNKPVVATCDVHFLDPEDEVYRRIIMAGQGFEDADKQAPLYFRTTAEMLDEFTYLGREKAFEVVVTNTNLIADMIDAIVPLRPDRCVPEIPGSDKELEEICFKRAYELYGDPLPEIVKSRLEKELNSIIQNGFAVMYIASQKLVQKSNEDGYLVGSRGSVGSSFVATMAGISEVNPLIPHYYCPKCRYSDFESDTVKEFMDRTGFDLPDMACPECGEELKKDGFDIPFETFLGFNGDKEPDIDLNFSGEYQSKAHKYAEVIFGEGQTFRAGTISTLADKTAYGYVKNYYEEHGIIKRKCEVDRIVSGVAGVKKSTGQHPGGVIILPQGEDINSFTPIQRPANDMETDIITTHFDYHSIDHNLLKLDLLGHDNPTIIRMLQDLTGVDPKTIPFQDAKVMSLFRSTEALGITAEQIGGCKLGALGVPEFGTDFVIQMLEDTKPESFYDLICISGLSHGTDVWLGNAQELIREGKATISTVISMRDDIMTYLINKGLDRSLAFNITEFVRRGRGLKSEWEEAMKEKKVPEWYIWSCKKIKYMFPKAHAAAYVMMAWQIAYFKVYYPLAYYAAFFSIRASAFNYEIMCQGQEHLEQVIGEYYKREELGKLTKKEQDSLRDMRIVQEMYARGFDFMKLDIYRAKAREFQIIDGKIMASFSSIDGLGEKAADAVALGAKKGRYLSRDDFRQRTKVSKTVIELMERLKLFGDLPESNQISLFDFV